MSTFVFIPFHSLLVHFFLVFSVFCIHFLDNLESVPLSQTGRYHGLLKIDESFLFFFLQRLQTLDESLFIFFKFLSFLFIFIDQSFLLVNAHLLVGLALHDLVVLMHVY